jgi:hypothetical protein
VCNAGGRGQEALKDAGAASLRRVSGLRFWALSLSTIFLSGKRNQCYLASMCLQRSPLVSLRDGFFEPVEKAKCLDVDTLGLEGLQPIEIPQNGQAFFGKAWRETAEIWKSLQKSLERCDPPGRARSSYSAGPRVDRHSRTCQVAGRQLGGACPRAMHERASVNFAAAHEIDLARFVRASFDSPIV